MSTSEYSRKDKQKLFTKFDTLRFDVWTEFVPFFKACKYNTENYKCERQRLDEICLEMPYQQSIPYALWHGLCLAAMNNHKDLVDTIWNDSGLHHQKAISMALDYIIDTNMTMTQDDQYKMFKYLWSFMNDENKVGTVFKESMIRDCLIHAIRANHLMIAEFVLSQNNIDKWVIHEVLRVQIRLNKPQDVIISLVVNHESCEQHIFDDVIEELTNAKWDEVVAKYKSLRNI